ncbi:TonB-dependent receptor plug domain-containing protein [Agriterribacter sp.]|uniref:TonB-dependent receptor plug domain-containing protein n=1 Tax=Agriterribacter sp. TaxID=2821509 RepID=UPI002BE79AEE|nr:TonB-dependent receptor plug domain-containing protein [Agriterribacter sp.]HRP54916.1 TonB-dependent receptor plug domain-containing protein [Agriterribacter sp.]
MRLIPKPGGKVLLFLLISIGAAMSVMAQDSLRVDSMILSNRSGLENILQGSVAGLRVKSWSGTPGAQSTLNLRGLGLDPTDQSTMPLILINGVPMLAGPSNVTAINPLTYFSPEQIESIEVIKDIDRLAAYGVQAPNGALNIIMKEGKSGSIHVRANAYAGADFLQNMDYKRDAFYNFNTTARRAVYDDGGMVHGQTLLVDGAGSYGSYLFGLSNHQDKGIIKNTGFGSQSLFLNAKYNITDRFTAHFYNNMALANRNGRYAGEYSRNLTLPVVGDEAFFMDKNRNLGLMSSMGLAYFVNDNLTIRSVASLSYEGASRDVYIPSNLLDRDIYASSAAYKRQLITWNTSLNWLHEFSRALQMDMTLGNEFRNTDNRLTSANGQRSLENGGSDFVKVVTGYNASQMVALSDHDLEKLASFYGIWKFKYKNDLNVNLVGRADGSSLYDKKWAFYPALGIHYDLKNTLNIPVKLNAGIGKTGVLSRPEVYRGQLDAYGDYYGGNYLGIGELYPAFSGAKSIDVTQIDAGITVALGSVLDLSVNYFNKTYSDFTYQRYQPNIAGIAYKYETGGKLGLSGVEVALNGNWIHSTHFSWASNLNIAFYRNKVKSLPGDIGNTSLAHLGAVSGAPVTSLVAWQGSTEKSIGNSDPKAFGGFTNTLRYRNISAAFILSYAWGADIAAASFNSRYDAEAVNYDFPVKNAETPYYLINEGTNGRTIYQGIRTIEDGSFVRLSRAAVSWHFNSISKKAEALSDLEIFIRGDNLFTLSRYSGINPEENITGYRRYDLMYTGTPLPASVALGIKVVF